MYIKILKTEKHPQKQLSRHYALGLIMKDVLSETNAEQNQNSF